MPKYHPQALLFDVASELSQKVGVYGNPYNFQAAVTIRVIKVLMNYKGYKLGSQTGTRQPTVSDLMNDWLADSQTLHDTLAYYLER